MAKTQVLDAASGESRYFKSIAEIPLLTIHEERKVALRSQRGDRKARAVLVTSNLRLVVAIAKRYEGHGVALLDLIQEGNLGLDEAAKRYKTRFGAKFSTYAALWIRQKIKLFLNANARPVRLPNYIADRMFKIGKVAGVLSAQLGREPTVEEIAKEMGVPLGKIEMCKSLNQMPCSLNGGVTGADGDETELADVLADDSASSPSESLFSRFRHEELAELLTKLDERDAMILRLRFGIGGRPKMTLQAVGKKLKVSRERVRQLECDALAKLRMWFDRLDSHLGNESITPITKQHRSLSHHRGPARPSSLKMVTNPQVEAD